MAPKKMYTSHIAASKENAKDYGFNHLNIPEPQPVFADELLGVAVDPPPFRTDNEVREYVRHLGHKLSLARDFILLEIELGTDPNRNMSKDATAVELAKSPMRLTFYTQELIRDIVTIRPRLVELGKNAEEAAAHEEEINALLPKFASPWRELRLIVATLMVGKTQEKKIERAEKMMVEVFGQNLVVEDVEEQDGGGETRGAVEVDAPDEDEGTDEDAEGESD